MNWTTGRSRFDPWRWQRAFFPLGSVSRPTLGSTQPPIQWVLVVLSAGVKRGRAVTLTTHPHLMSKSWISSYTFSHPFASISVLQDCLTFKTCLMYKWYLVCLCFEFFFASWLCCVYFYDILFHAHQFHQSNVTSCVSYCSRTYTADLLHQ
jgi:hypothetical protein